MGSSYSYPGDMNVKRSITGATVVHSCPPEPARSTHWALCGVRLHQIVTPIVGVVWLALPCLSPQPTTQQLSREAHLPASLLEWSVVGRDEETLAGLLPQLV